MIKKLFLGACCCMALQGAMAQVDGMTGASVQTKETSCGASCSATCCKKTHNTPACQLLDRLKKLQKRGIMLGHQDDPVYGTTWKWEEGKSDVLLTTGDYPAVMGFDLGKLELDSKENLDGVPFDRMRKEIIAQHERGGIVTLSWHPWNPVTGENAWDPKGDAVKAVLDGGEQAAKMQTWLDKVAGFINSLQTADGEKIPVIFRPWHEMNGGWFWWGAKSCTPAEYNNLFVMTVKHLQKAGCDNIVWAWSPNLSDKKTMEAFMERYPGDDYVDLMGVDIYEFDNDDANYQSNLKGTLDILVQAANQQGKLAALTETGCRGISKKTDWFTKILYPVLKSYPLSYVLFWRNAWDKPQEEAYLPGINDGIIVKDFQKLKAEKKILFAKDLCKGKKGKKVKK